VAQRPVIRSSASGLSIRSHERRGSNGSVVLNWTRGSLGATGHIRYADWMRLVFTTGASGAVSGQLDWSVWSARVMPSEGV